MTLAHRPSPLFGRTGRACLLSCIFLGAAFCSATASETSHTVTKGSTEIYIKKLHPEKNISSKYKATETKYFIHIPDGYDGKRAAPLILAISPGNEGAGMFGSFKEAAKKYGLFFACPDQAGNPIDLDIRGQRAVDTLFDVRARYKIDPEQIYVTGFSGGGRMSTSLVQAFPGLFAGHMPLGGIYFSNSIKLTDLKTTYGHYIFAGEKCFNRKESERALKEMRQGGSQEELLIGPGLAHAPPTAEQGLKMYEWFQAKVQQLSLGALKKKMQNAEKAQQAQKLGEALKLYQDLAATGFKHELIDQAAAKAKALTEAGAARMAAAEQLPGPDAVTALEALAKDFQGTELGKTARENRDRIAGDPKTQAALAQRKKAARDKAGQEALAQAMKLEQSGKYERALQAFSDIARKFSDTTAKAKAETAAARLKADPKVQQQKNNAQADRLLRAAGNYQRNNMIPEAQEKLKELLARFPKSKAAEKAKQQLASLK